jgi:hypothetical protein
MVLEVHGDVGAKKRYAASDRLASRTDRIGWAVAGGVDVCGKFVARLPDRT